MKKNLKVNYAVKLIDDTPYILIDEASSKAIYHHSVNRLAERVRQMINAKIRRGFFVGSVVVKM